MAFLSSLSAFLTQNTFLFAVVLPLFLGISYLLYNLFFHPLSHIPGSPFWTCSPLLLWYSTWDGKEASRVYSLHATYGPILRIAPNEVSISDGAALAPIYNEKGGFMKSECYSKFDINGQQSIFSTLDPAHRAVRSKAVIGLFSLAAIRKDGDAVMRRCADDLVARIKREKRAAAAATSSGQAKINLLDLTRCMALDAVTEYLFGERYGGLDEISWSDKATKDGKAVRLSASGFVDAFAAVGRFFALPGWLFQVLDWAAPKLYPDPETDASIGLVQAYTDRVTRNADPERDDTYQARLMRAGIDEPEASMQCMDLIFAGTDGIAMNLTTICWYLIRRPEVYGRLREEIQRSEEAAAAAGGDLASVDPQTLPYLRAVVKEGLRLSRTNPNRLPRVVPPGGWSFKGTFFPAGANVGCASYNLHHNAQAFARPFEFVPERWLGGGGGGDATADTESKAGAAAAAAATDDMTRDSMPFGVGPRQCIARNLATVDLQHGLRALVASDVLKGACTVADSIEVDEWFNSKVKGYSVEIAWD